MSFHSRSVSPALPLISSSLTLRPQQYGYHISALNQIQAVLTCRGKPDTTLDVQTHYGLPTCIPMSDATFSVVTSVYTVGGLLGSLVANVVMDRWGRKGAVRASSSMFVLGSGIMTISGSLYPLILGRYALHARYSYTRA